MAVGYYLKLKHPLVQSQHSQVRSDSKAKGSEILSKGQVQS